MGNYGQQGKFDKKIRIEEYKEANDSGMAGHPHHSDPKYILPYHEQKLQPLIKSNQSMRNAI